MMNLPIWRQPVGAAGKTKLYFQLRPVHLYDSESKEPRGESIKQGDGEQKVRIESQ